MGICNKKQKDDGMENTPLGQEKKEDKKIFKLLLLGAGGSGKSTVFRQVKLMYGNGYDEDDRLTLALTIHMNMVESIKKIVAACPKNTVPGDLKAKVENLPTDAPFNDVDKIGKLIEEVWKKPIIQQTYEQRSTYQLPTDIIHYFFDKSVKVLKENYEPTNEDLLRCRIHSSGVKQELFEMPGGLKFRLLDVGGQRNERKKWVQCFENVTAVLYVVAVSEYDQVCYEDNETNRVLEALDLFEDITNSEWFADTPIILFLNKKDLLAEKIKTAPMNCFFSEFKGDGSYESVINYLQHQFDQRNQQERAILSRVTCATNTDDIKGVFESHVTKILSKKVKEQTM